MNRNIRHYKEAKAYKGFETWWHSVQMTAKNVYHGIFTLFITPAFCNVFSHVPFSKRKTHHNSFSIHCLCPASLVESFKVFSKDESFILFPYPSGLASLSRIFCKV